jgi:hypothetical protein
MDLFQKLGLRLLSWEENMKSFNEEENKTRFLKEGILKNNEPVLLLETKKLNELTHENFIRIHHFLINQPFNFINLKYVLIKNDKDLFFAYEKVGPTLMEFLEKSELTFEVRLILYKQAVEIVYYLISLNENFLHFDFNFFIIDVSENNSVQRLPILKLIPHCKLI